MLAATTPQNDVFIAENGDDTIYAFRRNLVIAASAGTGKTYRLTALYLLLTLGLTSNGQPNDSTRAPAVGPERIVATTFSKAAAREIRTRVEGALRRIANLREGEARPFADILSQREARLGVTLSDNELRAHATAALDRWSHARIDTLHGVAAEIALENALALGLNKDARVLDEDEDRALTDRTLDGAFGVALNEGGERAEAARAVIRAAGGVAIAREGVMKLFDRLDEEGLSPANLTIVDATEDIATLAASLREVTRLLGSGGSKAFKEKAQVLHAHLVRAPHELFPKAAYGPLLELFGTRAPSKKTPADEAFLALREQLKGTNTERGIGLAAMLDSGPTLAARERAVLAFLIDLKQQIAEARSRVFALSFGDLLMNARRALRDLKDAGKAARSRVDALLVDELQDASRVQRDLVYLLREREDAALRRAPFADPEAPDLVEHGLMVVGDRKQSIYGFRGANVGVFARIALDLAGRDAAQALDMPLDDALPKAPFADFVALRESRRSGVEVLSFVNAFASRDFAAPEKPRDFELRYGPAEHLVPALGVPAQAAEVVFVRDNGVDPEGAAPLVQDAVGSGREGLVAAAAVLRAVDRGASYREVAVLARRRATLPLVELGLARLGIPYVVAGRALYDTREVRDVVALLRLLLDPRDKLALATVLRGPLVAMSDEGLARLALPRRGLVVPLLRGPNATSKNDAWGLCGVDLASDERARFEAFRSRFEGLRRAALRSSAAAAIDFLVRELQLDEVLACLDRPDARLGNVDRLAAIARARGGSVAAFTRWVEARIADETDEAEAAVFSPEDDAVRLTTIHASKGLDFPVVVLVDLGAAPRGGAAPFMFEPGSAEQPPLFAMRHLVPHPGHDPSSNEPSAPWSVVSPGLARVRAEARAREYAERSRLTYVAITRARRSLVLIGPSSKPPSGSAFATLTTALEDPFFKATISRTDDATALLHDAEVALERPRAATAEPPPFEEHEVRATPHTVAVATTPLSLFDGCARRFRFRHVLGIDEPLGAGQLDLFAAGAEPEANSNDDGLDPLAVGRAAHRVLERWPDEGWGREPAPGTIAKALENEGISSENEGVARLVLGLERWLASPFARHARAEASRLVREEPFVLRVELGVAPAQFVGAQTNSELLLRGAVDLCVHHADGSIDVLDYKRSYPRTDLAAYAFQLRTYALALARRHPNAPIRAGVVFLLGDGEPAYVRGSGPNGAFSTDEHAAFEERLRALGNRLVLARRDDVWAGQEPDVCRALGCGFLPACHGELRASARRKTR